jgi:triosephosphate isomerase (TIM)
MTGAYMSALIRPLVAGNWKMNGLIASLGEAKTLQDALAASAPPVDVAICPPFTLVDRLARQAAGSTLLVGAQDCHAKVSGAHTGDVSAAMLADLGAVCVIVGHSERRADHGETDADVAAKAQAVAAAGLSAILCVGETEGQRDAGQTLAVVGDQLSGSIPQGFDPARLTIAYEPVWAIGTGRTPTTEDVAQVHALIRKLLVERFGAAGEAVRILYGGSVKPSNAAELMAVPNVNGALVGGASLKAADFLGIIGAYQA